MPGYQHHVFVCVNSRPEGDPRGCCEGRGGSELVLRFKKVLAERGLKGLMRANKAGCLDHCSSGATVVVYPEGVWYGGVLVDDVEEIVDAHLIGGRPVERLLVRDAEEP